MSEKFLSKIEKPPEKSEIEPQIEEGEYREIVNEINFEDLKIGDRLIVETGIPNLTRRYEITVAGKRKDGLMVVIDVEEIKDDEIIEKKRFTARMPGGFTMHGPGLTPGLFKKASEEENNCLYFENLKNPKTGEREAKSNRTEPIKGIELIAKQEK